MKKNRDQYLKGIHKYWMKENNGDCKRLVLSSIAEYQQSYSYKIFGKKIQSYGSKDTEKEVNEDLKEEFEIVSETFEKTESKEYG